MTRSHARLLTPITPGRPTQASGPSHAFFPWARVLLWIALPAFLLSPSTELSLLAAEPVAGMISTVSPTNTPPQLAVDLPDMSASVLRLFGSLALVLGLFLGGVYLFRNWQRIALQKSGGSHLRIQEIKPLGHRQALYLVQCGQQRMLLASSPNGVNFITHVETSEEALSNDPNRENRAPFIRALQKAAGSES